MLKIGLLDFESTEYSLRSIDSPGSVCGFEYLLRIGFTDLSVQRGISGVFPNGELMRIMIFSQGSEIGDQRSGKKEKSGVEGWEIGFGKYPLPPVRHKSD